jgi:hypothetical protein
VINTATSVIACLLIALLTNTERRGDRALHRKLDTVAVALAELMTSKGDDRLRDSIEELRAAVSSRNRCDRPRALGRTSASPVRLQVLTGATCAGASFAVVGVG